MDKQQELTLKEKIGFAFVNLGSIPVSSLINSFLLIYYTDIVGISPAVIGTLFFVARFVDALGDPIIGFIIDQFPKVKFGKYRLLLLIGSIVAVANYVLLWFGPFLFPFDKVITVIGTYLSFGIVFDFMDIPLNSLIPAMSITDKDRIALSSIKGVSFSAGATVINTIAPLILAQFAGVVGYTYLIGGAVVLILLLNMIGISFIKEHRVLEEKEERYTLKDLWSILKIRPVFVLFITVFFSSLSLFLYQSSIIYYVRYYLGNVKLMSLASMVGTVGAVLGGLVLPIIVKRIPKRKFYLKLLVLTSSVLLILFVFPNEWMLFIAVSFVRQLTVSMMTILQYGMSAENVSYVYAQTNQYTAGIIASLQSLAMKLSLGTAASIQGFVLYLSGYVANQQQTEHALFGILCICFMIPIICYVMARITFQIGYRFTDKRREESK